MRARPSHARIQYQHKALTVSRNYDFTCSLTLTERDLGTSFQDIRTSCYLRPARLGIAPCGNTVPVCFIRIFIVPVEDSFQRSPQYPGKLGRFRTVPTDFCGQHKYEAFLTAAAGLSKRYDPFSRELNSSFPTRLRLVICQVIYELCPLFTTTRKNFDQNMDKAGPVNANFRV